MRVDMHLSCEARAEDLHLHGIDVHGEECVDSLNLHVPCEARAEDLHLHGIDDRCPNSAARGCDPNLPCEARA